jgi:hypothetical protein
MSQSESKPSAPCGSRCSSEDEFAATCKVATSHLAGCKRVIQAVNSAIDFASAGAIKFGDEEYGDGLHSLVSVRVVRPKEPGVS